MSAHYRRVVEYLRHALGTRTLEEAARRLKPRDDPEPPRVPGGSALTDEALSRRWAVLILNEAVGRAPAFAFDTLGDAAAFAAWACGSFDAFRAVARETTRHGQLVDMQPAIEGNHVYVIFEFWTGDASGQNMVTI